MYLIILQIDFAHLNIYATFFLYYKKMKAINYKNSF